MLKKQKDDKGDQALANELAEAVDVIAYAVREDLATEYEVRRDGALPYALARYLHYIDLHGEHGSFVVGEKARVCLTDSSRLVTQLMEEGLVRREDFARKVDPSALSASSASPRRRRASPRYKLFLTESGKRELEQTRRSWRAVSARIVKMLSLELPSEKAVFCRLGRSLGKALGGTR
jgi:hypothetical protein